jgi:hypothetical protein
MPKLSPFFRVPNAKTCFLPDGTDVCDCEDQGKDHDLKGCTLLLNVVGHVTFDVNDYLVRLGQTAHAPEKARFLADTFEWRMGLARKAQAKAFAAAGAALPQQLGQLWRDERRPPRERRRLLFELWCELDRSLPSAADLRRQIDAFIRANLPASSPEAYSPAELEELRARPGGSGFSPYDGGD